MRHANRRILLELNPTEDTPNGPQYGLNAQVALDQQKLLVEHQTVALQPGMTDIVGFLFAGILFVGFLFANIKTGTRRLIEFALAPLLKAGAESMSER